MADDVSGTTKQFSLLRTKRPLNHTTTNLEKGGYFGAVEKHNMEQKLTNQSGSVGCRVQDKGWI